MKKIKEFFTNPLVFLVLSTIIIFVSVGIYDNIEAQKLAEEAARLEQERLKTVIHIGTEYKELTPVQRTTIDDRVHKAFLEHPNVHCIKIVNYNDTTQYEIVYEDIDELYTTRNTEIEFWASQFCLTLRDVWSSFGYEDRCIRFLMLSETNYEQVYFDVTNGVIDYTIYDEVKTKSTREDWLYLYQYTYGKLPSDEELDAFIAEQETNGLL